MVKLDTLLCLLCKIAKYMQYTGKCRVWMANNFIIAAQGSAGSTDVTKANNQPRLHGRSRGQNSLDWRSVTHVTAQSVDFGETLFASHPFMPKGIIKLRDVFDLL